MGDIAERIWVIGVNIHEGFERIIASTLDHSGEGSAYPEYVRSDLFDAALAERDALCAQVAEMREALTKIAYMRPVGSTPRTVKGELIERIEKVALAALR